MVLRTLAAFVLVILLIKELPAQQVRSQQIDTAAKVGDHLVLRMTGDLAKEYAKCRGEYSDGKFPSGLQIDTIATIEQELDGGQIRIEHSMPVRENGAKTRLVTLSAVIDSSTLKTSTTNKGTDVYSSPGASKSGEKPTVTETDKKLSTLELKTLKGVKLRNWKLESEIGE